MLSDDVIHHTWYFVEDLVALRFLAMKPPSKSRPNSVRRTIRSVCVELEEKHGLELRRDDAGAVNAIRKPATKWSDAYIRGLLNDLILYSSPSPEAWFAEIYMLSNVRTIDREACRIAARTNHEQFEYQIAHRFDLTPEQLATALQRTFVEVSHHMSQQPSTYRVTMEVVDGAFKQQVTINRRGVRR